MTVTYNGEDISAPSLSLFSFLEMHKKKCRSFLRLCQYIYTLDTLDKEAGKKKKPNTWSRLAAEVGLAFTAQPTILDQKFGASCSLPTGAYSQELRRGANSKISEQPVCICSRADPHGQQAVRKPVFPILVAKPSGNVTPTLWPQPALPSSG